MLHAYLNEEMFNITYQRPIPAYLSFFGHSNKGLQMFRVSSIEICELYFMDSDIDSKRFSVVLIKIKIILFFTYV